MDSTEIDLGEEPKLMFNECVQTGSELTRKELSNLLGVADKYLCPSNFEHVKGGAKEKGYNLIKMAEII